MTQKARLLSLDVIRGLLVAFMILVNNPGSWEHVYAPFLHAEWHGFTPTDWIFPGALFVVGVSISLAFEPTRQKPALPTGLGKKILRRVAILFGLGLFLNAFPTFPLDTWRIPGVLQRIAIVFWACAWLYLVTNWRQQIGILLALLLGYWALLALVPVPGGGSPNFLPQTNIAAWLDNNLLGSHIWSHSISGDPEGILSTLPAIGTCILGMLSGSLYHHNQHRPAPWSRQLMLFGAAIMALGWVWGLVFPLNKNLWTSSFAVFTAGLSMVILAACIYLLDVRRIRGWATPFHHFGVNPIALYFLSGIVATLLYFITLSDGNSLHSWLYSNLFSSWLPLKAASLAFAIAFVTFHWAVAFILFRRKVFIKV
ncbi:MAG TPA: DUF5009 domain-containing protein [Cytophagales bacterium]|nr:DUF5009 domain-containing protein [Cytophagales bacterium]